MANELLSKILGDESPAANRADTAASAASTVPGPSEHGQIEQAAGPQVSLLGPSLHFKGALIAEEDLIIQGTVEGTIQHNADQLTIGNKAVVAADIEGRKIMVQGKMRGDLKGSQSVSVEASAQLIGDIVAPSVGLKEGAKFKGNIDTDGTAAPANKPPQGS